MAKIIGILLEMFGTVFLYWFGNKIDKANYEKRMIESYGELIGQSEVEIEKIRKVLAARGDDTNFDDIPTRPVD